jgi:hypothetical protein
MRSYAAARQILFFGAVPSPTVVATVLASAVGLAIGVVAGWPLWAVALAVVLPFMPIVAAQVAWTEANFPGLALFYVLIVTQGGHFAEHCWQEVQIHLLGIPLLAARGAFGAFDVEWVHFFWNTFVIAVVGVLLTRFPINRWIAVAAVVVTWHEIEHIYIMIGFLQTGAIGGPGLLATGGAISGGLPLIRADLHFFYNLFETALLVVAFAYQARRSAEEASKRDAGVISFVDDRVRSS